jgi:hypothetical protein
MTLTSLVVALALGQAPADAAATDSARAAQAAEKAAVAAQQAAEAAAKATAAAEAASTALVKAVSQLPAAGASVAGAPAAAPAVPGEPKWTGTAGLALISLAGNASTLTFNANVAAQRQWESWALGFKGYGTYGQSKTDATTLVGSEVVAMAAGGQLRGDRKVTDTVTVFVVGGGDTNHVKSIEFAGYGEAGAGITWVNVKEGELQKTLLRTDLAARYARELLFQYYPTALNLPDRDLLGPRAAVAFRYALNEGVIFTQDVEVIPNILGQARYVLNATTKLNSRLTESLSLGLAFQLNHDSVPPAGKLPTDTALTAGVELAL